MSAIVASVSFWTSVSERLRSSSLISFLFSSVFRLRSEEHTSELQSLMRISYAVFCLKKKKILINRKTIIVSQSYIKDINTEFQYRLKNNINIDPYTILAS